MKETRYLLKHSIKEKINGEFKITPDFDAINAKDQELFYDLFTKESDGTVLNRKEIEKVIEKDWVLDYLIPRYTDEDDPVTFICDFHSWIGERPDRLLGYPVSKKMKQILEQFKLNTEGFYKAKVLFNNENHDYFIWEQYSGGFDKYVDFKHSTFCERTIEGGYGNIEIQVENEDHLRVMRREKKWHQWAFKRAVMKPEFKEVDATILAYPYINIISERLKNALEEANITGIEIIPFHVEIEYLD